MTNEIGRKITSLTLMTIMVAGGLTFAAPGIMPAAHAANANLFVSAENSQFDNYMAGPQVIEVVIIDSDINDTTDGEGEPDVTVNGKILRMVQGTDGNWYGYFADRSQAQIADSTVDTATPAAGVVGEGLDFGVFCSSAFDVGLAGTSSVTVTDTVGIAIADPGDVTGELALGSSSGQAITATCVNTNNGLTTTDNQNVLREEKALNLLQPAAAGVGGQIGVDPDFWPFIQLYTLNPTGNVVIQYNKGGGVQTTTLTFDTVDQFAGAALDRTVYPRNSEVHVTITDLWLNIDPTDQDSWTFGTTGTVGTFYQVFDENGGNPGDTATNTDIATGSLTAQLGNLMCEDNCVLLMNTNVQNAAQQVLTLQDNDDSQLDIGALAVTTANLNVATNFQSVTGNLFAGTNPVTITEQGPNTGVFGTYDESDVSNIKTTTTALRGTSGSIDYNAAPVTVLAGFEFASLDIQPTDEEWSSGEEIPVVYVDGDANKNSRVDEDLDLFNTSVENIPALATGSPFTLETTDSFYYIDDFDADGDASGSPIGAFDTPAGVVLDNAFTTTDTNDAFSKRSLITGTASVQLDASTDTERSAAFIIQYNGRTLSDLKDVVQLPIEIPDAGNFSTGAVTVKPATTFHGFNYFNYDFRSFTQNQDPLGHAIISAIDIYLVVDETEAADNITGAGLIGGQAANQYCLILIGENQGNQGLIQLPDSFYAAIYDDNSDAAGNTRCNDNDGAANTVLEDTTPIGILAVLDEGDTDVAIFLGNETQAVVADFFSYGFQNSGTLGGERIASQVVRLELEETADNSSTFSGSLEYIMVNQVNILQAGTYSGITTIADDPSFIVIEDLTDEDSPRVQVNDLGEDGVAAFIADQEAAPSHSGVVSFDTDSYKIADTVVITLEDKDLNIDSDLVDIFTVITELGGTDNDVVGFDYDGALESLEFGSLSRLMDVTFDDITWQNQNGCATVDFDGLGATGFTLVETGPATGVFKGDFEIPLDWCRAANGNPETSTGLDMEVNYVDFRDASGEIIEVGDSAGVRANTGSISLDRTVYPVPFGVQSDFGAAANTVTTASDRSVFPIHQSGMDTTGSTRAGAGLQAGEFIPNGDLTIHLRVNDPDEDVNPVGEDDIDTNRASLAVGPVKVSVIRGSTAIVLGYAGGTAAPADSNNTRINVNAAETVNTRNFGVINEIAPDAGIFELDVTIRYTDGPASAKCPNTTDYTPLNGAADVAANPDTDRFNAAGAGGNDYCILQGDILQVEYTDASDASGDVNTVTDSATFDLRNGVLQTDKSVYIIGSDMILTLIEPDFDLDNDQAETYDLDLIEWDSDAATVAMGDSETLVVGQGLGFDPEPTDFRETGDSTGIFQIVVEIPNALNNDNLERGEEIVLEYTDWGPSGADHVGDEDEDVNVTVFTSNFGATVELDQKVYSWTDKVYITIVAPDHNFDSDLVDEIGRDVGDPIKISTRGNDLTRYKLVETGTDTGIFTGEIILTGFAHDADGDASTGNAGGVAGNDVAPLTGNGANPNVTDQLGPTDGFLQTDDDDGVTVAYEFSEDETVVGSALIRWNIGEVQWLEASYPASGTGVVRIIDPDMNWDPEAVDNFDVDVWSDSDAGGIDLTVTETNEATGIFEGTVFFTTTNESSGHRLRVAEGDTVTGEYEDNTLPDPYTTADELDITATTLIGTVVPPLERAPAANLRTVDAFGNSLDAVNTDQQVQISADLANGQDREQAFAYLVQIQDANGVTVSLAWITGSLSPGQSFSPALSWIPTAAGTYTATAFVWESVDNPTALSPPVTTTITVS